MTTKTIPVLACKDCRKRTREEWFSAVGRGGDRYQECAKFVRFHRHLDGECAGWTGLDAAHPLLCPACGSKRLTTEAIKATTSDTPCRDRCVTATGLSCDCECGGTNHGIYAHGKD